MSRSKDKEQPRIRLSVNYNDNHNAYINDTNTQAEVIVYEILKVLISKTITKADCNKVYLKINDLCFNYIYDSINGLLKLEYFQYNNTSTNSLTNDDDNIGCIGLMDEIAEPIKPTFDRDAFTLIKLKHIEPIEEEKEPSSSTQKLKILNRQLSLGQNSINKANSNRNIINLEPISDKTSFQLKNDKSESNNSHSIDLVATMIPNLNNYYQYDVDNVDLLRLEVELSKREDEEKRRKKKENYELNKPKQVIQDVKPIEFDMNKFTIDGDGQIIPYKPIPQYRLPDGFTVAMSNYKQLGVESKVDISNQYQSQPRQASGSSSGGINNENAISHQATNSKKNIKKNTSVSFNDISTATNSVNTKRYFKVSSSSTSSVDFAHSYYKQEEPLVISGNNFDLMNPETGVIVKNVLNGRKIKKVGSMDFYRHYNKYSLIEYEKLNELFRTKSMIKNKSCDDIQTDQQNNNKKNNGDKNKKCVDNNKSNDKDNEASISRSRNTKIKSMPKSQSMPKIVVKASALGIKMALSSLETLPEIELLKGNNNEQDNENTIDTINNPSGDLLKTNRKRKSIRDSMLCKGVDISDYDQMNKFSKTIMGKMTSGSGGWGNPGNVFCNKSINEKRGCMIRKPIKGKGGGDLMKTTLRKKFMLKPIQMQINNMSRIEDNTNSISKIEKKNKVKTNEVSNKIK